MQRSMARRGAHRSRGGRPAATAGAMALLLALTACGDDGDTTVDAGASVAADDSAADDADDGAAADTAAAITVTGVDYAYPDLPGTIAAGTTVTLQNDSEGEVHEILAFRIKDDEERPVAELVQAGEAEFGAAVEMRGVALAPPGTSSADAPAPPLVLEQPGRYAFACFIPTGAPPDEVMAAVAAFLEKGAPEGESPDYPQTGPPHAVQGMFAEVVVTAG